MDRTLGIRREDRNPWERRAPLAPSHVEALVKEHGIKVRVQPSDIRIFPDAEYAADLTSAVQDADAVVIATEWNEFRRMDMEQLRELVNGDLIIDCKNIYEPDVMAKLGFRHVGVGRGRPKPIEQA